MRQAPVISSHFWPRLFVVFGCVALMVLAGVVATTQRAAAAGAHVDVMTLADDINPNSLRILDNAVDTAQSDGATALVIQLDTPGGDLDSMKAMVQKELAATVPVVVYVSPQGGRAASAGLFVTLGANIAAMAPNTRIGASSPVDINGGDIPATLDKKLTNDLVAQVDDLCNRRQNPNGCRPLAEKAITDADSYPVETAVQQGLVDLESTSLTALLNDPAPNGINGWQVKTGSGQTVTLHTAGVAQQTLSPSFSDTVLGFLLDPNVSFILLILAGIGIYLEISHPGAIIPGVVGAIALVLFLLTAGSLSVNIAGVLLVVIGFILLIFDVRLPSHGVLTVGALISLVLGSLLLFNGTSNLGAPTLSPIVLGIMLGIVAAIAGVVLLGVIRSRRLPVTTGTEALIGKVASVTVPLVPAGRVNLGGEDWAARNLVNPDVPLEVGQKVRIVEIKGLTLYVAPVETPAQIPFQQTS
ncbi:MAG TPA: nodulation protein NfeD [Ktedonobacterales bacterium]|nr:nodulation protein NfeD [Ktedonobacterales bacterium]